MGLCGVVCGATDGGSSCMQKQSLPLIRSFSSCYQMAGFSSRENLFKVVSSQPKYHYKLKQFCNNDIVRLHIPPRAKENKDKNFRSPCEISLNFFSDFEAPLP